MLLTRPRDDSLRIARLLEEDGIDSLIWPLTEIEFGGDPIDLPETLDGVIFSSGNAVRAFAAGSNRRDLTAFCVGRRTAELARETGFNDVRNADGSFDALVDLIVAAAPISVHYPHAEDVSGDLPAALKAHGIACTGSVVYRARPTSGPDEAVRDALLAGALDVVTIWSRRNARLFRESLEVRPDWQIGQATLVCISENALEALGKMGFRRTIVASRPNATQMIAGIRAAVR